MTTELVLLLGLYAFILMGVFLGDSGPIETFKKSTPRLGAKIERNIAVGRGKWIRKDTGEVVPRWEPDE